VVVEEKAPKDGKIVFYWMELHPSLCSQLLWENNTRVLVDFTPGAGMTLKAALTLGIKSIVVCNNSDHAKLLTTLMREWIKAQIGEKNRQITPPDYHDRLLAVKDPRLKAYEDGKKRPAPSAPKAQSPSKKRAATNLDDMVKAIAAGSPAANASAGSPAATQSAGASSSGGLPAPAGSAASGAGADGTLQVLLKSWGKGSGPG
jgi:hypothetical protein